MSFLEDARRVGKTLRLITNARSIALRAKDKFEDLSVWYNRSSIANIISFSYIAESHRVMMDTLKDKAIYAKMSEGKWIRFK